MKKISYIILLILLSLLIGRIGGAEEPIELKAIELKDNEVELKISGPFTYTMYKPSDPYLIVVELPNVISGDISKRIVSDKKGISEIKVSETGPPTLASKIEILLDSPAEMEPIYKENSLTLKVKGTVAERERIKEPEVKLGEAQVSVKEPIEVVGAEEKPSQKATEIQTVGFEYKNGALRLIIKGNGLLQPTVFQLKDKVVVDIPDVSMKADLPQTVISPVKNVRYGMHNSKVRIVVDLRKKADFNVFQEENSIAIAFRVKEAPPGISIAKEVPSAVVEEKPVTPEIKYEGKIISLDFQNADIIPIFRLLAEVGGYNIVIHPGVSGTVTLKLSKVPWEQALDLMLELSNSEKSIEGNVLSIAPTGFFIKKQEEKKRKKETQPLQEELIPLDYADAAEMKTLIEGKKLLSLRGTVEIHPGENTLLVMDTEECIRDIKEFISKVNTPIPQIMIEAKIVEVRSSYSQTLGIRWMGTIKGTGRFNEFSGDFSVNTPLTTPLTAASDEGGFVKYTIGTGQTMSINMLLAAAEVIGGLRTLANPKILTMNKKSASIEQGLKIPVQTTTAAGSTTQYEPANLNLNVTPTVKGDQVQLKVTVANDSPFPFGALILKNTQSINTEAFVKDGETLILGGIYKTKEDKSETGVPFLSKIPILGWLFKTRTKSRDVTELMIFITPTIVKQPVI